MLTGGYGGALSIDGNVGSIQGGFVITGGTGRFKNAKGGGTVQGTEQVDPQAGAGRGQIELNGIISY